MASSLIGRCLPWTLVFVAIFCSIVSLYIVSKIQEGEAEYERHHSNWLIRNVASTKLEKAREQLQQAREVLFLTSLAAALSWGALVLLVAARTIFSACQKVRRDSQGEQGGKKAGAEAAKVVELTSDSSASSASGDDKDWEVVGERK